MKNKIKVGALVTLATAGLVASLMGFASPAQGSRHSASHVTICHRTGSHSNPYVVISPSASGVYNGHYTEHNENAVFPNTASDGKWGDIIPPFVYKGVTYSLNWNASGRAVFNNNCQTPTTPTTTTTETTTTTPVTTTTPNQTVTVTTPGQTVTVTTPGKTTTVTKTRTRTKTVYHRPRKFIFTR
jgi:hypothetical protein